MQKAGKAMKQIHGGLTMEKIDQTMYVYVLKTNSSPPCYKNTPCSRALTSVTDTSVTFTGTNSANNTH